MRPLVVSTFTSSYREFVKGWSESWADIDDVECATYIYEDQGSWEANTLIKPSVAERGWHIEDWASEPLWVFDIDTRVTGNQSLAPLFALLLDADVAIHYHDLAKDNWRQRDNYVSAGCVGFAPTPLGRMALAWWAASCRRWASDR